MRARVLLIEDNPANMQLMSYLLGKFGYETLAAIDGQSGLERAAAEAPDLILCDVQLPGIGGREVVRRIKADPELSRTPVIAVTAFAMAGDREDLLAAGFDGYISKPIAPELFVDQVAAFLPTASAPVSQTPSGRGGVAHRPARPRLPGSILVVDDVEANLRVLLGALEPEGYRVRVARRVNEALAQVRLERPDLVISDLHLRGDSGFDLIRLMQADPELRHIRFIFISSTVWGAEDARAGLALGADAFLLRPVEPTEVVDRVRAVLEQRPAAAG